jgi:hypothetical protein
MFGGYYIVKYLYVRISTRRSNLAEQLELFAGSSVSRKQRSFRKFGIYSLYSNVKNQCNFVIFQVLTVTSMKMAV